MAPFGNYGFGRQLNGLLHYEDTNGCSPIKLRNDKNHKDVAPVLIVKAGGCEVRVKAKNIQTTGAAWAIIVVGKDFDKRWLLEQTKENIDIELPVIILKEEPGNKLIDLVKKGDIPMRLAFSVPQSDIADIQVIMPIENAQVHTFLRDFKQFSEQFEEDISLTIYFYRRTPDEMLTPKLQIMTNCLGIADVYDVLPDYFKNCFSQNITVADCFETQIPTESLYAYQICRDAEMASLNDVAREMPVAEPGFTTHILINDKAYIGNLKPESVFEAVCSSFISSPDNCLFLNNRFIANLDFKTYRQESRSNKLMVIGIIATIEIILLVIVGLILSVIYSRIYQGIVYENVPTLVKDSVVMYRSFSKEHSRNVA